MASLKREVVPNDDAMDVDVDDVTDTRAAMNEEDDIELKGERDELKAMLEQYNYASTVPARKLHTNLFDLKSLLQVLVIYSKQDYTIVAVCAKTN